jgi:hypothetical protein
LPQAISACTFGPLNAGQLVIARVSLGASDAFRILVTGRQTHGHDPAGGI